MNKDEKQQVVNDLKKNLENFESKNLVFVDFKGIKGVQVAELRKSLKAEDIFYRVVKANLLKIVLDELKIKVDKNVFEGSVAVVANSGDISGMAKKFTELKDEQDNPIFQIKGGLIDSKWYSGVDVVAISKLPSMEVLIGKLLFLINSPLRRFVTVLKKPENDFVSVLNQIKDKKEQLAQSA